MKSLYRYSVMILGLALLVGKSAAANDVSKKLKILVAVHQFPLVSETFVINQIVGLIDQGHDVSIYANSLNRGIKIHKDVATYDLMSKAYTRIPKDIRSYDIILCQFGTMGKKFNGIMRKYKTAAKLVTVFMGYDISTHARKKPGCYDRLFKEGDFFLAVCESLRQRAISLGCPPDRILVNHSSINCDRFSLTKREPNFKKEIKVLSAGRLVEKKGLSSSLRAVALLHKKYPTLRFTIAGDGKMKKKYQKLAKNLGIEAIVTFYGVYSSDELAQLLDATDIFLGPSVTAKNGDTEGIPNTLKEAMAKGVPVISTYHGGIPEMIHHGENGLLVKEHDSKDLARQIEYLVEHPDLITTFGKAGRQTIEHDFEFTNVNQQLGYYLEMIAQGNYEEISRKD